MNVGVVKPLAACVVLVLGLLSGCATPSRLPPVRDGDRVDLVVTRSAQAEGPAKIRNQDFGHDTGVGASSGIVLGALSGVGCGPWAFVCIPAGMLVGGLTGTVAGAAVGLTGDLSGDKSDQIRERLNRAQRSHDLLEDLRSHVSDRARRHWQLGADPMATVVTVDLQELSLTSTRDERIGLVVRVGVTVTAPSALSRPSTTPTQKPKIYEYASALSALTAWLDENNDLLDTSLRSGSEQIAAQIVSDLALQ
ncbi:MAG: hypothetical protein OEU94_10165 [Aquincola sp.]|nr:hypothetical protein [Aquincola sp.]MDH4290881.1 hypothetical protein [Aquincola sp.]MDH5329163.1 hypothetical protein [Aquincola sp.]